MTTAPAAANFGASALEVAPPAENSAMSMPVRSAVAASSTTISVPRHGSVVPAERAEAKKRTLVEREVALVEQAAHDGADLTGGADDGDDGLAAHALSPHDGARATTPTVRELPPR